MSYCDHCQGQRFDRGRVLRALRRVRRDLQESDRECGADEAIVLALRAVQTLDLPHLDEEEEDEYEVIH